MTQAQTIIIKINLPNIHQLNELNHNICQTAFNLPSYPLS